jgi:hypothetical protein
MVSFFIARAIYDGAVTFRYITDAEVSDVMFCLLKIYLAWRLHRGRINLAVGLECPLSEATRLPY